VQEAISLHKETNWWIHAGDKLGYEVFSKNHGLIGTIAPWWHTKSVAFFTKSPSWKVFCERHHKSCQKLIGQKDRSSAEMIEICASWLYKAVDGDGMDFAQHYGCRPS
jgi:hypothetical protein